MSSLSLKNLSAILGARGEFSVINHLCTPIKKVRPGKSLHDKLGFLNALKHFAPEVRLHSQDTERPSSVEFFFSGVHLKYNDEIVLKNNFRSQESNIKSQSILGKMRDGISSEADSPLDEDDLEKTKKWKLEIAEHKQDSVRRGEANKFRNRPNRRITKNVPCYCHAECVDRNANWYDFQYLFFYPYNSMGVPGIKGIHEGDWEHITVRADLNDMSIKGIYFSAHTGGYWATIPLPENAFNPNSAFFYQKQNGQPIVFSAKNSHASYPFFGRLERIFVDDETSTVATVVGGVFGGAPGAIVGWLSGEASDVVLPDDLMDNQGPVWDCRGELIFVGEQESPTRGQEWIRFTGRWGGDGDSPLGPAFQEGGWWTKKERVVQCRLDFKLAIGKSNTVQDKS